MISKNQLTNSIFYDIIFYLCIIIIVDLKNHAFAMIVQVPIVRSKERVDRLFVYQIPHHAIPTFAYKRSRRLLPFFFEGGKCGTIFFNPMHRTVGK